MGVGEHRGVARTRDPGVIAPFGLLIASVIGALAVVQLAPYSPGPASIPWFIALTLVAAGVRSWGLRAADRTPRARLAFWAGLVVTLALVLLNPAFGLYGFIAYPDATRQLSGRERGVALLAVAGMVAIAQTGGVGSPLLNLPVWLLFVAVNLVVAGSMLVFDRQRQRQHDALQAANEQLRISQERNQALQAELLAQAREAGATEERDRLAREIHDTIAQDLVAIITQLAVVADEPDPDERQRRLDQVDQIARGALSEARRSVHALGSPRLDAADLPDAVRGLLAGWQETTGVAAGLEVAGSPRSSGNDEALLRIAQEALANVARHAGASEVGVRLRYPDAGQATADAIVLEVADNGGGFDAEPGSAAWLGGHGLGNMAERARQVGGQTLVVSRPGAGTTVTATVPGRWR